MIRFFNEKIVCIDLKEYDRDKLLNDFISNNLDAIVLLYDKDEYYGYITYESIINNRYDNGIFNKKFIVNNKGTLFQDLYSFFGNNVIEKELVPIFSKDMKLILFAYQYYSETTNTIENYALSFLEEFGNALFIRDIYPWVEKVCIFDFNEYAFRFYNILKKRGIPVEVVGEKWTMLYPEALESNVECEKALDRRTMNIYAEGTANIVRRYKWKPQDNDIKDAWSFIIEIINANVLHEIKKLKYELLEKKISTLSMIFPVFQDLENCTADEYYRHMMEIVPGNPKLDVKNENIKKQVIKCWCKKSGDQFANAMSVRERYWKTSIYVGDKCAGDKKFGNGKNRVYLIGPCIVGGACVDEEDSLGYYIYNKIRKYNLDYMVECISICLQDIEMWKKIIRSLMLYEGDIVIMVAGGGCKELKNLTGYPGDIDLEKILSLRQNDWFWDAPIHTNQRGNFEVAEALFEGCLKKYLQRNVRPNKEQKLLKLGHCFLSSDAETEIKKYISNVRENGVVANRIGSIVMNCNPITIGHKYLIEQALQHVDFLYIFLVEEDKSEFLFADRMEMLQIVTKRYKNVKVVPSGKFILSYETVPLYFEKSKKQEEILNATEDLKIFGEKISAELGITVRFVGNEPYDKITRQYNEEMKKILPAYGVSLIEIPRLAVEDTYVSASKVRKYISDGNKEKAYEMLPEEIHYKINQILKIN